MVEEDNGFELLGAFILGAFVGVIVGVTVGLSECGYI